MASKSAQLDLTKLRSKTAELGLTQANLADITGISPRTITTIFTSGEVKTLKHVDLLAQALQVDVDWLLLRKGKFADITQTGNNNAVGSNYTQTNKNVNTGEVEKLALLARIEELQNDKKKLQEENTKLLNIIEILSKR